MTIHCSSEENCVKLIYLIYYVVGAERVLPQRVRAGPRVQLLQGANYLFLYSFIHAS